MRFKRELSPGMRTSAHVLASIAVAAVVVAVDVVWVFFGVLLPSSCDTCGAPDDWDVLPQGIVVIGVVMTWAIFIFFAAGFRRVAGLLALAAVGVALLWIVVSAMTAA